MATAFGGAIPGLALATRPGPDSANAVLTVAIRYEWIFWAAAGVLAMTGIGNLASFGADLSQPSSPRGATLMLTRGSVLAMRVLSLPRTLAVARMSGSTGALATGFSTKLRNLYGATAAAFATILALAVWLAHG